MKKIILAAGALALLGSTAAQAADVVTYQEPVAATPAPTAVNWSGFYAGGMIGGSWAEGKTSLKQNGEKPNGASNFTKVKKTVKPDTFIGGLYAGYNFELANNIVLGVETDFLWNSDGKKGYKDFNENPAGTFNNVYGASVKQKWNGATRVRAGYAFGPEKRFLPYIAAGVSYADFDVKSGTAKLSNGEVVNGTETTFSKSKSRAGWNVGVGVDYVPPIMNDHLVLRAEYRYTDFGTETYNKGDYEYAGTGKPMSLKQKVDYNQNDFRVGVAYKF